MNTKHKVDNAIITAAGFGSRFVPLSYDMPKGLLEVLGERMVERQIKQLHEAGITDITIVVGYLREKFEYLIDKYNVKLIYNPEYSSKNSLSTLYHVRHLLKNTYILASDNWLRDNIYNEYESRAWYSGAYMKGNTSEWCLITDEHNRITEVQIGGSDSYAMYGPAYFDREFSEKFKIYVEEYYNNNYKTPYTYYEILIQNDDSSEEIIEEIMEKLDDKEDDELVEEFEKLAEKYSISASAENGGIVKSATKNQVDKDVWETLEDLDKYELSEEIETENGIYIVIKKSEDKPKELKKVKTEIKEAMAQEKLESDQFLSYDTLTALRNEYKVAFFDKDLKDMYNDFLDEVETTKEQANTEKED
mgnify:CR=1 FL=1